MENRVETVNKDEQNNQIFLENQKKFQETLENYLQKKTSFTLYYESMKTINTYFKEKAKK